MGLAQSPFFALGCTVSEGIGAKTFSSFNLD